MEQQPSDWTKATFGLGLFEWRLLYTSVSDGSADIELLQIIAHNLPEAIKIFAYRDLQGWGLPTTEEEFIDNHEDPETFDALISPGDKRDFNQLEISVQFNGSPYSGPKEYPFISQLDIYHHSEVPDKTIEWPDGFKWPEPSEEEEEETGSEEPDQLEGSEE